MLGLSWVRVLLFGVGIPTRVLGFRVPDYITIKEWDWELYWGDTGDWEKARKSLGIRISSTPGEFEW